MLIKIDSFIQIFLVNLSIHQFQIKRFLEIIQKSEEKVYQMIEEVLRHGQSLKNYECKNSTESQSHPFEDAMHYPEFFRNNLIDDVRVVKVFKDDPQANIRVFYYQYLKLCFEIEHPNIEFLIEKVQDLITNPQFCFIFPQNSNKQLYNDMQFKRLFIEFFDLLNEAKYSVDEALVRFPIADTVLVYFFRTLLILGGKTTGYESYIDRSELYEFLIVYFNIEVTVYERCLKFVDTDIFVYEDIQNEVYMVYLDYQQKAIFEDQSGVQEVEEKSLDDSFQSSDLPQKSQASNAGLPRQTLQQIKKLDSKVYEFIDFTQHQTSNIPQLKQHTKESISRITQNCASHTSNNGISMASNKVNSLASYQESSFALNVNSNIALKQNQLKKGLFNKQLSGNTQNLGLESKNKDQLKNALKQINLNDKGTTSSFYYDSTIMNDHKDQEKSNFKSEYLEKYVPTMHYSFIPEVQENTPTKMGTSNGFPTNYYFQNAGKRLKTLESVIQLDGGVEEMLNKMTNNQITAKINHQSLERFKQSKLSQVSKFKKQETGIVGERQDDNRNVKSSFFVNVKKGMKPMNVTKEFTSTFILENMSGPSRAKIENIKSRARATRDSIFFMNSHNIH